MLTRPAGSLRDWLWFALAALAPSLAVGVLGLSALNNEQAAVQRETTLSVAAAAQRLAARVETACATATRKLAETTYGGSAESAVRVLAELTPPFATPVLLDRDRNLVWPHASTPATVTPDCEVARTMLTSGGRDSARPIILSGCPDLRSDTGLWLWPALALEPTNPVNASRVSQWLEGHSDRLSSAERELLSRDLRSHPALSESERSQLLRLLTRPQSRHQAMRRRLLEAEARENMSSGPGTRRFNGSHAFGTLRVLDDGRVLGFVVDAESLADALGRPPLELGSELSAQAVNPELAAPESRVVSQTKLTNQLALRVMPRERGAVERTARRNRLVLIATGALVMALAFVFAGLLFARMRAARRASALRTDFVSTVSHELRTPIASLRMLAELLEEDRVEPDERTEVYQALAREARRLGDTVDRLLGFSRMAAGRQVLEVELCRLAECVGVCAQSFADRHPSAAPLELELDRELEARVDRRQLETALTNLLENAHKYAPEGGPYRVSLFGRANEVVLEVSDHGPGIARRDQRRIFEPFERADDRLSRATEGSGIGLSLVRHVARAHGGRVELESRPGEGARFSIILPRRT